MSASPEGPESPLSPASKINLSIESELEDDAEKKLNVLPEKTEEKWKPEAPVEIQKTEPFKEEEGQRTSSEDLVIFAPHDFKRLSLQELHSDQPKEKMPPRKVHSYESIFCKYHDHTAIRKHSQKLVRLCRISKCILQRFQRPCWDIKYQSLYNFLLMELNKKFDEVFYLKEGGLSGEEEETFIRKESELSELISIFTYESQLPSSRSTSTYSTSERTLSHMEKLEDSFYSHTKHTEELEVPRMLNRILHGPRRHDTIKQSLGLHLRESLKKNRLNIFQICGISREYFTGETLLTKSIRLAYGLQRLGVEKRQIIVISSRNCIYIDEILLAALYIGAACCFLDPDLEEGSLLRHLEEIKTSISISLCHGDSLTRFSRCLQLVCPTVKIIYFFERKFFPAPADPQLYVPYGKVLAKLVGPPFLPDEIYNFSHERAFVVILEDPKDGILSTYVHTQITLLKMLILAREDFYHLPDDKTKTTLTYSAPLTIAQMIYRLISIDQAINNIIIPRFNEFLLLQSIREYNVNILLLRTDELRRLPKYYLFSLFHLPRPLKHVVYYGDALPCCIHKSLEYEYGVNLIPLFSLPEAAVIFEPHHKRCHQRGAAGHLAPNVKAVIIDLEGKRLGPHMRGELWINPGRRHLARPLDQSWGRRVTNTAWICTGYLAYFDRYGLFYVLGKLGLEYTYKSLEVNPLDIETALYFHSNILEAAVIPLDFIWPWLAPIEKKICPSKAQRDKQMELEKSRDICISTPSDICTCVCWEKPFCLEYCPSTDYSLDSLWFWDHSPVCSLIECDDEECECSITMGQGYFEAEDKEIKKKKRKSSYLPPPDCKTVPCRLHPLSTWCPCENKPREEIEVNPRPIAFAIRRRGELNVSDQEILDYLKVELPSFMQLLRGIQWVQEIPRNSNGEILRSKMKIFGKVLDHGQSATTL